MSAVASNSTGGLPTRSEIENWHTADLENAAATWRQAATDSDDVFDQHRRNIDSPGGTTWEGDAKDAALDRIAADVSVVRNQSGVLREATDIAENGGQDIQAAQRKALEAITDAEADGFRVSKDLSVTDTRRIDVFSMAARRTAATEHSENIRWNAEQLVQTDNLVGQRLRDKAVELESIRFDGEGERPNDSVQLVSNEFKLTPIPEPGLPGDSVGTPGGPTAAEIRGVLSKLPVGAPGVREVSSFQELEKLWKWLEQNGTVRPGGYGPDPSKGVWIELPDGTRVGRRNASRSNSRPALDIKIAGEKGNSKVHVNPKTGGAVNLPAPPKPVAPEPPPKPAVPTGSASLPPVEPKSPMPPARSGGFPVGGGSMDPPVPWPVHPPGGNAGDPDLPVIGDGIPDNPDN